MNGMRCAGNGWRTAAAAAAFFIAGGGPTAASAQGAPQTFLLIVSGASGEPRFATQYHDQALALRTAATKTMGIPDSLITYLAEDPSADRAHITARSTRDEVQQAIARIASRARGGDAVLILLLGHGSSQNNESRFNLPGPDLTATEFAKLLDQLLSQTVAFVNTSNSSGDFVKSLSAPHRIVITATKSGFEGNETLFGQHFVDAYAKDGADTDKDGRVSLLEAFLFARREVQRDYEESNRLQTEHAVLDDDADGTGHTDAGDKGPDGLMARAFFLAPAGGVAAVLANDPRATELLATQRRVQAQIDSIRLRRAGMKEDEYQAALEPLLLKLAETTQALRALEAKRP